MDFDGQMGHYLIPANNFGGVSHKTTCNILKYYPFDKKFRQQQLGIKTEGAYDWESFNIGRRHFLALAVFEGDEPQAVFANNRTVMS